MQARVPVAEREVLMLDVVSGVTNGFTGSHLSVISIHVFDLDTQSNSVYKTARYETSSKYNQWRFQLNRR